jgi:hypothetical protein
LQLTTKTGEKDEMKSLKTTLLPDKSMSRALEEDFHSYFSPNRPLGTSSYLPSSPYRASHGGAYFNNNYNSRDYNNNNDYRSDPLRILNPFTDKMTSVPKSGNNMNVNFEKDIDRYLESERRLKEIMQGGSGRGSGAPTTIEVQRGKDEGESLLRQEGPSTVSNKSNNNNENSSSNARNSLEARMEEFRNIYK